MSLELAVQNGQYNREKYLKEYPHLPIGHTINAADKVGSGVADIVHRVGSTMRNLGGRAVQGQGRSSRGSVRPNHR